MKNQRGFTLVETITVLFITFTLIVVTSSLFFKVKERVTYDTYLQQFKLLTYEAYSLAKANERFYWVMCTNDNKPYLLTRSTNTILTQLQLPETLAVRCHTRKGPSLLFDTVLGLDEIGTVYFTDLSTGKQVEYTANFTYGRIRKAER